MLGAGGPASDECVALWRFIGYRIKAKVSRRRHREVTATANGAASKAAGERPDLIGREVRRSEDRHTRWIRT